MEYYDVIVVGAGPAGLAAGNKTKGYGLETVIFEADMCPRVLKPLPKLQHLRDPSKVALVRKMLEEAGILSVEIRYREKVTGLRLGEERKVVETEKGSYSCYALILAIGTTHKWCGIPGATWPGRGVAYCAECHGYLFEGKDVVVIGSGNEAVEEALQLVDMMRKVTLIAHPAELNANDLLMKKAKKKGIRIVEGYIVERIEGDVPPKVIKLQNIGSSETKDISAHGVFIVMEPKPSTVMINQAGIKTHRPGCIVVDRRLQTNVEGVYAAGLCASRGGQTILTCAKDGAKAGLVASLHVKQKR